MNRHKDINIFVSDHQPCTLRMSHALLIMSWLAFHMFLIVSVFTDLGKAVHRESEKDRRLLTHAADPSLS